MTGPRFVVRRAGALRQNLYAVCDQDQPVMFASWGRARKLALHFNRWDPTDAELVAYLAWGDDQAQEFRDEMVPLELRYPADCARCGQQIPAGERAHWHPDTKTVLHPRQPCPLPKDNREATGRSTQ